MPELRKPFRPTVRTLEDRLLCSFTPVTNTTFFPYSAIAHVNVWYDRNHNGINDAGDAYAKASAVMIGPDTALTSAHVVYDAMLGGMATQVVVTPGQNGKLHPFGSFRASTWAIPSLFSDPRTPIFVNSAADIAVITLAANSTSAGPVHAGNLTGWFTPRALSNSALAGLDVLNDGYPAATLSGMRQYRSSGAVLSARDYGQLGLMRTSDITLSIQPGSSGSPLFRRTSHGAFVVGLTEATLVDAHVNLSTKITPEILRFIAAAQQTISPGGHLMSLP
jgi:V8-like Glu-specific endopeptidase